MKDPITYIIRQLNMNNKSYLKLSAFISLTLFLAGCEIIPTASTPPSADPVAIPASTADITAANKLYQQGKKREAANAYFAASKNHPSPQRERLILQGAEIAATLPDINLMKRYLAAINTSRLDKENIARYNYTKALIAMANNQPKIALDLLPVNTQQLSTGLGNKIRITRVRAADYTGDHYLMARERIAQDKYLKSSKHQQDNRNKIWSHLTKLPKSTLDNLRKHAKDRILLGWLDLAFIQHLNGQNSITQWKKRFPSHPASRIATKLAGGSSHTQTTTTLSTSKGKPVAIMLPLNGSLSPVGKVLTQGIVDAHKQLSPSTRLTKYDTSNTDASVLYNQATKAGAQFILGPFSKGKIASIARNGYLQIPLLSLNYLVAGQKSPANLVQFGLLPEDEAIQVAQLAMNNGQSRAAVIVPNTNWGRRLESAFTSAYKNRGGSLVKVLHYPNQATSYNNAISNLMNEVNESIDMIFLAASPTQARMIFPSIRQQNTANKPVYATSHIFSGNESAALDGNLNGIIYTEIPWVLANPVSNHRYPRLYALGHDSFAVSQNLDKLKKGGVINGKTGKIRYSRNGTLHRTLKLATFKDGRPTAYAP